MIINWYNYNDNLNLLQNYNEDRDNLIVSLFQQLRESSEAIYNDLTRIEALCLSNKSSLETAIIQLKTENDRLKDILRIIMDKSYPELVISYPEFMTKNNKNH